MLIAISGPAGGVGPTHARYFQAYMTRRIAGRRDGLVFRYDNQPWPGRVIDQTPFTAVAALAQRWANPTVEAGRLRIPDLDCLRSGGQFLRRITPDDFTPETLKLAQAAAAGHPLPEPVVIDSLSRLYEQVLVQVLAAATRGLGDAERAHPVALAHASDALARLCWDLSRAKTTTLATLWEVETWRKGKEVGIAPMLPKSALNQIDFWLRVIDERTATVERALQDGWPSVGSTITLDEPVWLDQAA